jgi:hypothetical protein
MQKERRNNGANLADLRPAGPKEPMAELERVVEVFSKHGPKSGVGQGMGGYHLSHI